LFFFFFFFLQEEKKPEESKVEEKKPEESKEEKKPEQDKTAEESKDEKESKEKEPAPPPEIVLRVFMHCEGCARKVRRSLKGFPGNNHCVLFFFSFVSHFARCLNVLEFVGNFRGGRYSDGLQVSQGGGERRKGGSAEGSRKGTEEEP